MNTFQLNPNRYLDLGEVTPDPAAELISDRPEPIQVQVITDFSETSTDDGAESFAEAVLQLTNEFRAQYGLSPLRLNRELSITAQKHSQAMAEEDFFNHIGLNGSEPWDRAAAEGYTAQTLGENIAAGQATPEQVFQGWVASEGHRENLLNPNYTELGVGYFKLENDTGQINYVHYWTQVFGSGNLTFRRSTNKLDGTGNLSITGNPDDYGLIRVLTLTEGGTAQLDETLSYRIEPIVANVMDSQQWAEGSRSRESIAVIQVDSKPVLADVSF